MLKSLTNAFDQSDDFILITDEVTDPESARVLYMNKAMTEYLGVSARKVDSLRDIYDFSGDSSRYSSYMKARKRNSTYRGRMPVRGNSEKEHWMQVTLMPLHVSGKDTYYLVHKHRPKNKTAAESLSPEFTESMRPSDVDLHSFMTDKDQYVIWDDDIDTEYMKEVLQKKIQFERAILDSLPGIFTFIDSDMNYVKWNANFEEFTGYTPDEIASMEPVDFIAEEDRDAVAKCIEEIFEEGSSSVEAGLKTKEGTKVPHYLAGKRFDTDEKSYFLGYAIDISKQARYQSRLEELVEQRETLLQEIHHRVKNNMAIISGLLDLQKEQLQDDQAISALKESQLRLQTMAEVHQQLYQEKDLTDINSRDYLKKLLMSYEKMYNSKNITIDTRIGDFKMNINQAIPLGLLFNELVTNAYKHAFDKDEEGKITVNLDMQDGYVNAEVIDNGKGIDEEKLATPETLGYTIINTLKKQLDAELQVNSDAGGTSIKISFKREVPRGSASNLIPGIT